MPSATGAPPEVLQSLEKQVQAAQDNFIFAMDDDFNSAGALGGLFDLVRVINQTRTSGASDVELQVAQDKVRELSAVLGLQLTGVENEVGHADAFIDLLLEIRTSLRNDKQWAYSDLIRDRLKDLGVTLEDSKDGTTWRWA